MVVRVKGSRDLTGIVVEAGAQIQTGALIAGLRVGSLVAGPAEVLHRPRRAHASIDLLPGVPADVADPDLARSRPEGEAERIAHPVGDDPPRIWARGRDARVV